MRMCLWVVSSNDSLYVTSHIGWRRNQEFFIRLRPTLLSVDAFWGDMSPGWARGRLPLKQNRAN